MSADRSDLRQWLMEALKALGGRAAIPEVCKYVWTHHEGDLRKSGNLFFSWQYDIRWAATELRKRGLMQSAKRSPRGIWLIKH